MKTFLATVAVCLCSVSSQGQTLPPDIHPVTLSRMPPVSKSDLDPESQKLLEARTNATPGPGPGHLGIYNPKASEGTGILGRALEKDRNLRYQTATDLKTELLRLKRDTESGGRRAADDSRPGKAAEKSIAILFFENLSGV